ncbi:MAG: antitoxin [Thermodesulfobacteriota bacterium]|nr:antitoxin [Thermodesulfobacteriota bacterium]
MATLQVRSIDDQLYKALGRRATMENRSISQEVIAIIKAYLSSPKLQHENSTRDFLAMCGTWDDKRNPEEIIEEIRQDRRTTDRFQDMF